MTPSTNPQTVEEIVKTLAIKTHEAKPGQDESGNFNEAIAAIEQLLVKARIDEVETPLVNMLAVSESEYISVQYFQRRLAELQSQLPQEEKE